MSPSPLLRQMSSHFSSPSGPADDELSDELSEGGSPGSGFGFGLGMGMGMNMGIGSLGLSSVSVDRGAGDEVDSDVSGEREKEGDGLVQDRCDVLVERLSELIRRLQKVPPAGVLDELHQSVDKMETRMGICAERHALRSATTHETVGFAGVDRLRPKDTEGLMDEASLSGPGNVYVTEAPPVGEPTLGEATKRIIESAEVLNARLASAVLNLRARKEESDVSLPLWIARFGTDPSTAHPRPPCRAGRGSCLADSRPRT